MSLCVAAESVNSLPVRTKWRQAQDGPGTDNPAPAASPLATAPVSARQVIRGNQQIEVAGPTDREVSVGLGRQRDALERQRAHPAASRSAARATDRSAANSAAPARWRPAAASSSDLA